MVKAFIAFISLSVLGCASFATGKDPKVVSEIDLNRYAGRWYEIARYPTFFQRNCERSTADYQIISENKVSVFNQCYKGNAVVGSIEGTASAPNAQEPAKLRVDFGFLRKGDYWVIALDPNYEWAVVSAPKKSSLFILARKAPMNPELLQQIVNQLKQDGFDTARIIYDKY